MLESSLIYIITRTFPESLIVFLSGMILLDLKVNFKELMKGGLLFGFIVALIRMLPINFGVHTVFAMVALGLMLFKKSGKDMMKTMITTCVVWIALALSESVYILIALGVLKIPMDVLTNTTSLQAALTTLPSLGIAFLIIMAFNKIRKNISKKAIRG